MAGISAIIAGESYILREGIKEVISRLNIPVRIYEFEDWDKVLESIERTSTNIVLLDPVMIDYDEGKIIGLKSEIPVVKIVGILDNSIRARKMVKFLDGVISLADNKKDVLQKLGHIFNLKSDQIDDESPGELSKREQAVLRLVAAGLTNQQIAEKLFISAHTVITHRKNITRKLGIKTVAGLTVYAILNNLAGIDEIK